MSSPTSRYTGIAMILHWAVAVLIMINIGIMWTINHVPDGAVRPMIDIHKSVGITVLGLVILRVLWRFANPPPALPASYPGWERKLSHAAHIGLYILIFALPISGWMHDSAWNAAASHPMSLFYVIPWFRLGFIEHLPPATKEILHTRFGLWHLWLGYCLYALFALHVLGALKHQIIDRKAELQRMLPWGRTET